MRLGMIGREHVLTGARHRADDLNGLIGQRNKMRLRLQLALDLHLLGWNHPRHCLEVEFVPLHQPNFLRARDIEDADLDTTGSKAAIIPQAGHHLWHLRVGRRPVSLLAMQLPGRGQQVFEVAAPCGRVLARAKLQRLGSVHQPLDPLARPRRRDRLHAPDRLERLQHVVSCDLVDFQIMQARYVADGARPLLLLFLRQTLAPAGYCSSANSLNVLPRRVVARFLTRGSTPSRFKATLYSRALLRALLNVSTSPAALSRSPILANSICARLPSRSVKRKAHTRSPLS